MASSRLAFGLMLLATQARAAFPGHLFQLPGIESTRECKSDYEDGEIIWDAVTIKVDCCSHHEEHTYTNVGFNSNGEEGMVLHSRTEMTPDNIGDGGQTFATDFLAVSFEPSMKRFMVTVDTRAQIRAVGEDATRLSHSPTPIPTTAAPTEAPTTNPTTANPTSVNPTTSVRRRRLLGEEWDYSQAYADNLADNPGLLWWNTMSDCQIDECSLELHFTPSESSRLIMEDVQFLGPVTAQVDRNAFGHLGSHMRYPGLARLYGQHPFVLPGFVTSHDVKDIVVNDGMKMKIHLGPLLAPLVNLGTENRFVDVDGFVFAYACPPDTAPFGPPTVPCQEAIFHDDGMVTYRQEEATCEELTEAADCEAAFVCGDANPGNPAQACYKCHFNSTSTTCLSARTITGDALSTCENVPETRPEECAIVAGGYPCGGERVCCPLGWSLDNVGDRSACVAPEVPDNRVKSVPPGVSTRPYYYANEWESVEGEPATCPGTKLFWPQHNHFFEDLKVERRSFSETLEFLAGSTLPPNSEEAEGFDQIFPDIPVDQFNLLSVAEKTFWTPCALQTSQAACEDSYFFAPESLTHHACIWSAEPSFFEPRCHGPIACPLQYYPDPDPRTIGQQWNDNKQSTGGWSYTSFSNHTLRDIVTNPDCNTCTPAAPPNRCSLWGNEELEEPCFSSTCHSPHCTAIPRPFSQRPKNTPDPQVCCPIGHWDLFDSVEMASIAETMTREEGDYNEFAQNFLDTAPFYDTDGQIDFGPFANAWTGFALTFDLDNAAPKLPLGLAYLIRSIFRPRAGHLALKGDRSACGFFDVREECAFWGNNDNNPGSHTKQCRDDSDCFSGKCHEFKHGEGFCLLERCSCSVVPEGETHEFQTVCCPVELRENEDKTDADFHIVRYYPSPSDRSRCVSTDAAPKVCSLWDHDEHRFPRCYTADKLKADFGPSIAMELVLNYDVDDNRESNFFHSLPNPKGSNVLFRGEEGEEEPGSRTKIVEGGFHRMDALNQIYTCTTIPEGEWNAGRQVCCPVDLAYDFEDVSGFGTGVGAGPVGGNEELPPWLTTSAPARRRLMGLDEIEDFLLDFNGNYYGDNLLTEFAWNKGYVHDDISALWDYKPRRLIGDGSACSGPQGHSGDSCGLWGNPHLPICECGEMSMVSFMPFGASSLSCAVENFPDKDWCEANKSDEPFGPEDKCCGTIPDTQPCGGKKVCCPAGMWRWGDGSACTGGKYWDPEAEAWMRREDCALWGNFESSREGAAMPRCTASPNYLTKDGEPDDSLPGAILPQGRIIPEGEENAGEAVCCPEGYELFRDNSACMLVGDVGIIDWAALTDPNGNLQSYGLSADAAEYLLWTARREDDIKAVRCVDDPNYREYVGVLDSYITCQTIAAALDENCKPPRPPTTTSIAPLSTTTDAPGATRQPTPLSELRDPITSPFGDSKATDCGYWGLLTEQHAAARTPEILALGCFAQDAAFACAETCGHFFAASGLIAEDGENNPANNWCDSRNPRYNDLQSFSSGRRLMGDDGNDVRDACYIFDGVDGVNEDLPPCPLTQRPTPTPTLRPTPPTPQPTGAPTESPSAAPTESPSASPTTGPSVVP